jgi:eukaryotic-like serine/threonine-protein kinase
LRSRLLQLGQGRQAAAEFQKLIDHPEVAQLHHQGALARLQLGRAQAMMGDKATALKSYQNFLTLWKDADPDIPIYKQAKAEYAKRNQAAFP